MSSIDEETGAFVKVLEKSRKRGFQFIFDLIVAFMTVVILELGSLYILMKSSATPLFGVYQFIRSLFLLYSIIMVVITLGVIIDTWWSIGIFGENKLGLVTSVFIVVLIFSVLISFFSTKILLTPIGGVSSETIASFYVISQLFSAIVITYYLWAGIPHFALTSDMKTAIEDLHQQIKKKHAYNFEINKSIEKAVEWLKFKQLEGGIWGEEHPLLETSLVLKTFFDIRLPLSYSWTVTNQGVEEIRSVEHTYYVLIDLVQSIELDETPEKLLGLEAISLYDRSNLDPNHPLFQEWREKIHSLSEWDLIQELSKYDPKNDIQTTPLFFYIVPFYKLMGDLETLRIAIDTIGATMNLIIERYRSSYQTNQPFDIHPNMIALLYITLLRLTDDRWTTPPYDEKELELERELEGTLGTPTTPDTPTVPSTPPMSTPSAPTPVSPETLTPNAPAVPTRTTYATTQPAPVSNIGPGRANMGGIRALLKRMQYPEGYWKNGIVPTANCLLVISDQETPEDFNVKLALNFLKTLQSPDGSWYEDIRKTCAALTALYKVNTQIVYPLE